MRAKKARHYELQCLETGMSLMRGNLPSQYGIIIEVRCMNKQIVCDTSQERIWIRQRCLLPNTFLFLCVSISWTPPLKATKLSPKNKRCVEGDL